MNRPLPSLRAPRAKPPATPPVQPVPGSGPRLPEPHAKSPIATIMLWILIVYLAVPVQYFSGDFDPTGDVSMSAPNPLARTIKLGLLLVSIGLLLWKSRLASLELKCLNPMFIVFLVLVPASALWSVDSEATINRFISILSIVSVCFAFTMLGWGKSRFQGVLRPLLTTLLVASIIFGLLYPQYAIEAGEGTLKNSWRGLTSQKNQFGMMSSIGVVLWLHAWLSKEKRGVAVLPWVCICFYCVLLSRSSTSLMSTTLSTMFMLLVMVAPSNLRKMMPYVVSAFATLVVVYALAVLNIIPGTSLLLDPIASLTGKDMTFSNRSLIWDIIKEHIQLSPWLGSGYGAYWTGPLPTSPSYVFLTRMGGFYPTESHNGYLEIVNDLGFVGLIVLLGYLLYWVRQSLQLMRFDRAQGALFLALFFQQAVTNLSESTWLAINSGYALGLTALATFCLARSLLEQRLRQRAAGRSAQVVR